MAFERVLDFFKLQNVKDSHQEALQNLFKGQDMFLIQPTGSGKTLPLGQGRRLTRPAVYSGRIDDRTRETAEIEPTFGMAIQKYTKLANNWSDKCLVKNRDCLTGA